MEDFCLDIVIGKGPTARSVRLDLPPSQARADPRAYARAVRRYLESDPEADGSLLALFSGDAGMAVPAGYQRLLSHVRSVLDQAGMPVRDTWYVGDEYWRDAFCTDPLCCPFPGRSVQEIRDSTLNTEMVYRGSSVGPAPRNRSGPVPAVPALHLAAVREAEAAWTEELDSRTADRTQFRAVLDCWETMLRMPGAEPWLPEVERDAFLRATLLFTAWRDAILIMAAAGRAAAEAGAEQLGILDDGGTGSPPAVRPPLVKPQVPVGDDSDGGPAPATPPARAVGPGAERLLRLAGPPTPGYGDVLMGVAPQLPDWSGLDRLDRVFEQLAALGGQPAAAALTGRGWISWCRGRGSYAAAYLGQALELEPRYRLAELLLEVVGRGAVCGWAARKEAAWQKFGGGPMPGKGDALPWQ